MVPEPEKLLLEHALAEKLELPEFEGEREAKEAKDIVRRERELRPLATNDGRDLGPWTSGEAGPRPSIGRKGKVRIRPSQVPPDET